MIRVGLAGYGLAGETFHAPLIHACDRMTLAAVMTSRDAPCAVRSLDELLGRSEICCLILLAVHLNLSDLHWRVSIELLSSSLCGRPGPT